MKTWWTLAGKVFGLGLVLSMGLWMVRCAPPLQSSQEMSTTDGGTSNSIPDGPPQTRVAPGETFVSKDLGDGVTQVRINSSDESKWLYFSFSFGRLVEPSDAANSTDWDLGFQRFKVKSNSGISGKGGVEVAILEGASFDSLQEAPREGYHTDKDDGDDEDSDPDYAFLINNTWYAYNPVEHTLKPRDRVYVLKSAEGQYYKLQFLSYYDENGNSGFPTFKWAKIKAPSVEPPQAPPVETEDKGNGVTEVRINSEDRSKWVYYSFETNAQVTPTEPEKETNWHLGFQRFQVKTNGGVNGALGVEVAVVDGTDFASLTQAPKEGYLTDKTEDADNDQSPDWAFLVQGAWFAYNPQTHQLSPRERLYVVKIKDQYYKLQFLAYYKDKTAGYPVFQWAKIQAP